MKKYLRFSIYSGAMIILITLWKRMAYEADVGQRILLKTAKISAATVTEFTNDLMTEKEIQHYLRRARKHNEERQLRVKNICERYNLGIYRGHNSSSLISHPKTPLYKIFLVDTTNKISWCPIDHAAFETWIFFFGLMSGYAEEELNSTLDLQDFLRQRHSVKEAYEIEEALQTTLKFMVVRHPFERILSMYKESLRNTIQRNYNTTENPMEFKRNQMHSTNSSYEAAELRERSPLNHPSKYDVQPQRTSFQDFISYILDTEFNSTTGKETPLTPYYLLCTPCLLKYQIIAELETMMEDQIYIVKAAELQHKLTSPWRRAFRAKPYSSHNSEERKKYFSQISKKNVYRLFEKYRLDFELFNYDIKNYLDWAS